MKKFLCISLLLVCLVLVFSACGEGAPAETTGEVTTQPTPGEVTTQAVTTEQTTVPGSTTEFTLTTGWHDAPLPAPFGFECLSDFYLYMEENPSDHTQYEMDVYIPNDDPFPGKLVRIEEIFPSLVESEELSLYYINALNYSFLEGWPPEYTYEYYYKKGSVFFYVHVTKISEEDYDFETGKATEWDEELECMFLRDKETNQLSRIVFYSLDGYKLALYSNNFPKLLSSDVTELNEILENPTFSCERLRIISETLRAMND